MRAHTQCNERNEEKKTDSISDIDKKINKLDFNIVFYIEIIICLIMGFEIWRPLHLPYHTNTHVDIKLLTQVRTNRLAAKRNLIAHNLDRFSTSITIIICTHWNWLVASLPPLIVILNYMSHVRYNYYDMPVYVCGRLCTMVFKFSIWTAIVSK